jgi:(heptosyl)LPS beta-1,4-glucosyltransferase
VNRVTAVIKAKDEAAQIQDAVASARLLADDVLVIDDHSSDATADLARDAGAQVVGGEIHHGRIDILDKQGFSLVSRGWILRMDADERLTPALARQLNRVIDEPSGFAGARYARRYWMFGAPVSFGGWLRPLQLGLFRADSWDRTWPAHLHSQVPVTGPVAVIEPHDGAWMEHHDYDDVAQFAARSLMTYAAADAAARHSMGERFRARSLVWRPVRKMAGGLVLRRGYRDGARGWVLAALLAAYDISVHAHLWDLERRQAGRPTQPGVIT